MQISALQSGIQNPRPELSHRDAMMRHAMKRFRERCGIILSEVEYEAMNKVVVDNLAPPVAYTRTGRRVFKVRVRGVTGYGIWFRQFDQFATFYPSLDWVVAKGGKVVSG